MFLRWGKGADQQLPPPGLRGIREVRETTNSVMLLIKLGSKTTSMPRNTWKNYRVNPHQLQKNNRIERPVQDVIS